MNASTSHNDQRCPHCRLPLVAVGRLVAALDDNGNHFVFAICRACHVRLGNVPRPVAMRHVAAAASRVLSFPDRFGDAVFFNDGIEAKLYCHLQAERLSSTVH